MTSSSTPVVRRTTPPGTYVLLYDGHCSFCTKQSQNLLRLARPGVIDARSFQDGGVLEKFPGITHEACMKAMYLIAPDGLVYAGFEAAVRAVATRRPLGFLAYVYYLPGLRFLLDQLYALIARHRYRLMGKAIADGECSGGTCALHLRQQVTVAVSPKKAVE